MTLGKDPSIMEGIESEFTGHGLVFGKFMPPTNGHLHFIEFARQSSRRLTIMVCSTPQEPIPGEIRYQWMKELFPDCNVVHHYADIQQEPKTSPDDPTGAKDIGFFEAWRDSIHKHCPGAKFDTLFASEEYGFRIADIMGIKFIPVDIRRDLVPISGTKMRDQALKYWEYLNPVIRPYYVQRVAIIGPQGSGKSAMAESLAAHFGTCYVGDYGQSFLDECERQIPGYFENNFFLKDISTIARGQIAGEKSLSRQANRVLFCDTDLKTTCSWSEQIFETCPSWVKKLADQQKFNLYLLMDPRGAEKCKSAGAIEWPVQSMEQKIAAFEQRKEELRSEGKSFAVIEGADAQTRLKNAIDSVYQAIPALAGLDMRHPYAAFLDVSPP